MRELLHAQIPSDRPHVGNIRANYKEFSSPACRTRHNASVPDQTHYVHLPQEGSFLSHFFFLRRQFKHTLEDFAPSEDGEGGSDAGILSKLEEPCIDRA